MQVSDDLMLGPVVAGTSNTDGPSPMERGVGPMGRSYVWDTVPLALSLTNITTAQITAAAGILPLIGGTGAVKTLQADGSFRYVLDVPRAVSLTVATTNQSAINFTVRGFDVYGQAMTEVIAGPNANTVQGKKAFKSVVSVTASAAVATNGVSVGTSDKLGIPVRVTDVGYLGRVGWNNTLAENAATVVVGDATAVTGSTGDVRGTLTPSSATDGAKRLVVEILCTALQVGPNATRIGAVGVDNFAG